MSDDTALTSTQSDNHQIGSIAAGYQTVTQQKKGFLAAFAILGNISRAAQAVGVTRNWVHYWREQDPAFDADFALADLDATEALEAEARRRAVEGTEKPVYQGGVVVGTVREYSDTLLIFLLKGRVPQKYRDTVTLNQQIVIKAIDKDAYEAV